MIKRIIGWFFKPTVIGPNTIIWPSRLSGTCLVCALPLEREGYTRREREPFILECPSKHYRVYYSEVDPIGPMQIENDSADAEDFCVRRFFQLGFSDVIPRDTATFGNTEHLRLTIKRIITREEMLKLVEKYKRHNLKRLMVML